MSENTSYQQCGCKIGRAINSYDLGDLNAILIEQYQREGASLRDLANIINRRILRAEIEQNDDPLDTDRELYGALDKKEAISAIYDVLTDDETPAGQRARVRTQLEQAGIDLESIRGDWVTHPTVRSHLRECCDVETSSKKQVNAEGGTQTIEWAQERCRAIVNRTLERLQETDEFNITSPEISISIRITCTECQQSYRPSELITTEGCDCRQKDTDR